MIGLVILTAVAMIALVIVMFVGIAFMAKGGALNDKYGNKLMFARVGLQVLVLVLVGVMFMIQQSPA